MLSLCKLLWKITLLLKFAKSANSELVEELWWDAGAWYGAGLGGAGLGGGCFPFLGGSAGVGLSGRCGGGAELGLVGACSIAKGSQPNSSLSSCLFKN